VPQSGHPPSTSVPLVSMSCGKTKGRLLVSDARSANDHEIIGKPPSPFIARVPYASLEFQSW
jgi:hypothetical protein